MAYVPGFKYDIFISYAWIDNYQTKKKDKWVDYFARELEDKLKRFVAEKVSVFRDKQEISEAQIFNSIIKDALDQSAIMIALTSNNWLFHSIPCKNEREHFFEKIQKDTYGLKVKDFTRIVNVRLYDISHEKWPDELQSIGTQTEGFAFYKKADGDSADFCGEPLEIESSLFDAEMSHLSKVLHKLLDGFKKEVDWRHRLNSDTKAITHQRPLRVFIADVHDNLSAHKKQLINEIQRDKSIKLAKRVPPPFEDEKHSEAFQKIFKDIDLSIHLLDVGPGRPVNENSHKTYPQVQAEFALKNAKSKMFWFPPSFDINNLNDEDKHYIDLINELEMMPESNCFKYCQSSYEELPALVRRRVKEIRTQKQINNGELARPKTILIDCHNRDKEQAIELVSCHTCSVGYSRLSFIRESFVVNCQFIFAFI